MELLVQTLHTMSWDLGIQIKLSELISETIKLNKKELHF